MRREKKSFKKRAIAVSPQEAITQKLQSFSAREGLTPPPPEASSGLAQILEDVKREKRKRRQQRPTREELEDIKRRRFRERMIYDAYNLPPGPRTESHITATTPGVGEDFENFRIEQRRQVMEQLYPEQAPPPAPEQTPPEDEQSLRNKLRSQIYGQPEPTRAEPEQTPPEDEQSLRNKLRSQIYGQPEPARAEQPSEYERGIGLYEPPGSVTIEESKPISKYELGIGLYGYPEPAPPSQASYPSYEQEIEVEQPSGYELDLYEQPGSRREEPRPISEYEFGIGLREQPEPTSPPQTPPSEYEQALGIERPSEYEIGIGLHEPAEPAEKKRGLISSLIQKGREGLGSLYGAVESAAGRVGEFSRQLNKTVADIEKYVEEHPYEARVEYTPYLRHITDPLYPSRNYIFNYYEYQTPSLLTLRKDIDYVRRLGAYTYMLGFYDADSNVETLMDQLHKYVTQPVTWAGTRIKKVNFDPDEARQMLAQVGVGITDVLEKHDEPYVRFAEAYRSLLDSLAKGKVKFSDVDKLRGMAFLFDAKDLATRDPDGTIRFNRKHSDAENITRPLYSFLTDIGHKALKSHWDPEYLKANIDSIRRDVVAILPELEQFKETLFKFREEKLPPEEREAFRRKMEQLSTPSVEAADIINQIVSTEFKGSDAFSDENKSVISNLIQKAIQTGRRLPPETPAPQQPATAATPQQATPGPTTQPTPPAEGVTTAPTPPPAPTSPEEVTTPTPPTAPLGETPATVSPPTAPPPTAPPPEPPTVPLEAAPAPGSPEARDVIAQAVSDLQTLREDVSKTIELDYLLRRARTDKRAYTELMQRFPDYASAFDFLYRNDLLRYDPDKLSMLLRDPATRNQAQNSLRTLLKYQFLRRALQRVRATGYGDLSTVDDAVLGEVLSGEISDLYAKVYGTQPLTEDDYSSILQGLKDSGFRVSGVTTPTTTLPTAMEISAPTQPISGGLKAFISSLGPLSLFSLVLGLPLGIAGLAQILFSEEPGTGAFALGGLGAILTALGFMNVDKLVGLR